MKKRTAKDKTTMTAREVAVLIEDLRGQFRVFGEGLDVIRSKLDATFEMAGKNFEGLNILERIVSRNSERLTSIEKKVDGNSENIELIKPDIEIIKTDITEIKGLLKDQSERISLLEKTALK